MVEELFAVRSAIPLNLEFLGREYALPETDELAAEKPEVFKLCGALPHIDFKTEKALREEGDEYAELVNVLDQQSDKINQILSFLISIYDKKFNTFETYEFSGNGYSFLCPRTQAIAVGDIIRTRIYLLSDSAAVYCYARVLSIESVSQNEQDRLIRSEFVCIEDDDRERIISACFSEQRRMLRARTRNNAKREKNKAEAT